MYFLLSVFVLKLYSLQNRKGIPEFIAGLVKVNNKKDASSGASFFIAILSNIC